MKNKYIGLEWADEISQDIITNIDQIPLIEIIPDNFFYHNLEQDNFIKLINDKNIPVMIHSVALSLLSLEPFKNEYFEKVLNFSKKIKNIASFSDHLCMTEFGGHDIGQLTTTLYNQETLTTTVEKINLIQDVTKQAFAIENIALPFIIPNQEISETDFINELINKTGCKVVLDLNNLYTNEVNFGINAKNWIKEISSNSIDSIHLAGGFLDDQDILQDGHCEKVPQPVWDLYNFFNEQAAKPVNTIVERTGNNSEGIKAIFEDLVIADRLQREYFESTEFL